MDTNPSIGAKAYHLRKLTGGAWPDLAEHLDYRPDWPRNKRGHQLMIAAKGYALTHRKPWPVSTPASKAPERVQEGEPAGLADLPPPT